MEDLVQDDDEGRGKLRNAVGRRMLPLNYGSLNRTSYLFGDISKEKVTRGIEAS